MSPDTQLTTLQVGDIIVMRGLSKGSYIQ